MAYRETSKVRDKKAQTHQVIVDSAMAMVAEGGFNALQMSKVARRANIATGTLYRYFASKEALACDVFIRATKTEVARVRQALSGQPSPLASLQDALRVFARRALRSPTLAWALIAEPVDVTVDAQRLHYRLEYATLFASTIDQAIQSNELAQPASQHYSMLISTAIVGAIAEALIGPLATKSSASMTPATQQQIIEDTIYEDIIQFCLHGLKFSPGINS